MCTLLSASPAIAKPWVRGFVVESYAPAFLYGGPAGTKDAPGSDCPRGTIPDNDYRALLQTGWRTPQDIAAATAAPPDRIEPWRLLAPALHQRGFRAGIDTYINPFAAPDPGLAPVTGRLAEGFNLDGKPTGFVSPSGARGIDNALYRAWGCLMAFRGAPDTAPLIARANTRMREGMQTIVIRLSAPTAPADGGAVTVEIGYGADPLVSNNAGQLLRDYSYRIAGTPARLTGRMRGNVVSVEPVPELVAPGLAWSESNRGPVRFARAQLRLTLSPDGGAMLLLGGYRDWRDLYARASFNVALEGPFAELDYHQNLIAMYYALQRNADAFPDASGRNTAISTAWLLTAIPAFVVDPAAPVAYHETVPSARIAEERRLFLESQASHRIGP